MVSYPSITSLEVIIAGALNFKMAPLHFVYFTQELINAMEKKYNLKEHKICYYVLRHTFQRKM